MNKKNVEKRIEVLTNAMDLIKPLSKISLVDEMTENEFENIKFSLFSIGAELREFSEEYNYNEMLFMSKMIFEILTEISLNNNMNLAKIRIRNLFQNMNDYFKNEINSMQEISE